MSGPLGICANWCSEMGLGSSENTFGRWAAPSVRFWDWVRSANLSFEFTTLPPLVGRVMGWPAQLPAWNRRRFPVFLIGAHDDG